MITFLLLSGFTVFFTTEGKRLNQGAAVDDCAGLITTKRNEF
jgi:hypothetical protein